MFRILVAILVLALMPATAWAAKTVHVRGYYRKDGTYVQPHMRSAPGSGSNYVEPTYVPPPVVPRTDYRSSARTAMRTTPPRVDNTPRSYPEELRVEPIDMPEPAHEKHPFRLWTDASGQFHVVARFRSYANGTVKIERQDTGGVVAVRAEKLSPEDQRYIKQLSKW